MINELLLAGARAVDVDRRENAALNETAIEMKLAVTGALEFLEDDFVHPAAGIDQRARDDGETAAALDVARRTEKSLRLLQRVRLETAGHRLALVSRERVVSAREPGDRVEEDHDVLALLDSAARDFDHHLGAVDVTFRRFVERG